MRLTIIESTLTEPTPGWIEGVKVADAILLAYARGKVSFFPGKRNGVIDLIPADLVANSILIALGEQYRERGQGESQHHIYQCCSGGRNPLTMGSFIDNLMAEAKANHQHYDKLFTAPPNRNFVAVDKKLFTLVAGCVRFALILFNQILSKLGMKQKIRARRNIDTALELSNIFSFYAEPKYVFQNDKLLALSESLGAVDQELFPVDSASIDWAHYIRRVHIAGLNRYALKGQAYIDVPSSAVRAGEEAVNRQVKQQASVEVSEV